MLHPPQQVSAAVQTTIAPASNYSVVLSKGASTIAQAQVQNGVLRIDPLPGVEKTLTTIPTATVFVPATKLQAVSTTSPSNLYIKPGFSVPLFSIAQGGPGTVGVTGLNATELQIGGGYVLGNVQCA